MKILFKQLLASVQITLFSFFILWGYFSSQHCLIFYDLSLQNVKTQGCAWLYFTYGRLLNSSVVLVDAPGWHINTCMYFESVNAGWIPAEQWGRTLILPTKVQTHRWGHWRWFQRGEIPWSISVACTLPGVCFLNESLCHVAGELTSEPSIQCRKQSDYWTQGNFKVLFHACLKLNFGDWLHPHEHFCWSALAGLLRLHNSVLDHQFST